MSGRETGAGSKRRETLVFRIRIGDHPEVLPDEILVNLPRPKAVGGA